MNKFLLLPLALLFTGCSTVKDMQVSQFESKVQGGKVECTTFETEDGETSIATKSGRLIYASEVAHDSGRSTTITMCFENL